MAETPKIRLVRCPKCGNLLPEFPDYSVYKCGGCGAVLKAKKKASASDGFLEKSDEAKNVEGNSKLETMPAKVSASLDSLSENERDSDRVELCKRKDRVTVEGGVKVVGVSSSKTDNKEVLICSEDKSAREKNKVSRLGQSNIETEIGHGDESKQSMKQPIGDWVGGDDQDMNLNGSKSVNSGTLESTAEVSGQLKNSAEVLRSRVVYDRSGVETEGFWGFDEDPRAVPVQSRFSPSVYHGEGPSNYKPNSFYAYGDPMKNSGNLDRPNLVERLEPDRVEFTRKLNELKEEISRLEEKPREKYPDVKKIAPSELHGVHAAYNVSTQPFSWGNHVPKPPSFNHSHGPAPFVGDHMHNFYSPRHAPTMILGSNYMDSFRSQMLRRPSNHPPPSYPKQLPHDYFSRRSMDFNQDFRASSSWESLLHQPTCSCLHCYHKSWQVPPKVPGIRTAKDTMRSNFYHHDDPVKFGPKYHDSVGTIPLLHSQDPQSHRKLSMDCSSDLEGFYHNRPRRLVVTHGNRQRSRPIAGGAPFITCCKCFELLKLPRKFMTVVNNQKKLQCGSCLTINSLELKNKRLIISVATRTKRVVSKVDDASDNLLTEGISSRDCSNAGGMKSCSVAFDNSGYDFDSADTKEKSLSEDQRLNLSKYEKGQSSTSSSSISTEEEKSPDSGIVNRDISTSAEEEKSPDSGIVNRDISTSAELPSKDDISRTIAGSDLNDYLDNSSSIHTVSFLEKGNRSKQLDQEHAILNDIAYQQNADNDASVEIELEVSFNDYLNTSLSQKSVEVSREEDQPRIKKGQNTFLVGFIKKSFRDFSGSNQSKENERPNVSVNGQPISDHLVKKAEKLAGPIEPGDYWYDFQAGFWGVMGQPCLGIVTPFIKEFNYPMPANCAAGNTGVFVNGRELHQIDLDLLASRGLPDMRDKKYIVEFSGRVLDKDSGKELDSLGKLAPTVEKVKRGFGMRVPKVAL